MAVLKPSGTAIVDEASLAASTTTALTDCTAIDCTKGTQLVFFCEATFNGSATSGASVTLWPSYDGTTWVTSSWSGYVWSVAVSAGNSVVIASDPISPTVKELRVKVENLDGSYAITSLKIYYVMQTAG